MEYIFGTVRRNGATVECLKVVDETHGDLRGFQQTVRRYPDCIIIDSFRIVEKYHTDDGADGKAYDWYEIDKHYRWQDSYTPAEPQLRQAGEAAAITFVTLAESGGIDAVTAGEHMELFEAWAYPVSYAAGQLRKHEGKLYRCLQAHTSQADWTPDSAASLWVNVSDPAEAWPEWSQPVGAQDAYDAGAQVSHNGKHWTSDTAANVWEPGVYGWTEVEA